MVDYRLRKAEEAEAELEAAEGLRALRLAMGGTMSLNVALEFASLRRPSSFGPDKRPWIAHGVHSASTDPHTILRWSWTGAACAVATGERMEVLDVDVRGAGGALPLGAQGILLHVREG
ncbi:MAG: bifunctional DNA primase/polymerase [Pseudolabrys sp.]